MTVVTLRVVTGVENAALTVFEAWRSPYTLRVHPPGAVLMPNPAVKKAVLREGVLAEVKANTFGAARAFEAKRFPWTCKDAPRFVAVPIPRNAPGVKIRGVPVRYVA